MKNWLLAYKAVDLGLILTFGHFYEGVFIMSFIKLKKMPLRDNKLLCEVGFIVNVDTIEK